MPSIKNDVQLLAAVKNGNTRGVEAALEAGANVNGHPDRHHVPIVAAIIADRADMVEFLLDRGADPDRPVTKVIPYTTLGERALHIAAKLGQVEVVRLLLTRSRADPNTTDHRGGTPLMMACTIEPVCVEMVRLLLDAGADPALPESAKGFIPLHVVAMRGHMDVVDMLYARVPATLNLGAAHGVTPLFSACAEGQESMVSKLLSLGARQPRQPMTPDDPDMCPLVMATKKGFVGVVRVLVKQGGVKAVGGTIALEDALATAVLARQGKIVRLLLTAEGRKGRSKLANIDLGGTRLLHGGAGCCYPAAVSVLLEAGADEAALDSEGRTPRDNIGNACGLGARVKIHRGEEIAVRRMLERAPAYRARSWAWPSDEEAKDAGPPGVKPPPVIGVRIFRPKEKSSGQQCFVRLVDRYCAKN